jgi:DNA polymerase-3 subunit delta'
VLPEASAEALDGLVALAEGAPGRAVRLAEGEGLGLHQALREVLEQLPALPVPAQHALADRLAGVRDGSAFVTFMELLQREVAAATAAAARGAARPAWMGSASLADWAALWDRLGRIAAETETYNLDRKQAVLNGLAMLADPGRAEA